MKKKRIQRFYIETIEKNQTHYEITGDQCHYITRVLRLETEDRMILFDGSGSEWMAKIIDRKKNRLLVELMEETTPARESPIKITLIQSISRGQRMDAVMQKSTELGITRIVPVFSKNTVVKMNEDKIKKRLIHWKNILISASEQSGRTHIPNLMDPIKLDAECLKEYKSDLSIFFDTTGFDSLDDKKKHSITVVIGPEGGFTEDERQIAIDNGYSVIRSGPRLLRTETAPIMALSILQYLYGDLSN
ncbi:16S rRNA (uracil(1498)-N(3))-methyltransferase [Gammaproteobacteria bacterium]|nr:16S rRNA (uracil(1498)-N(3))-methyltransferase [Gammaproteobacteria bacterium]